MQLGFSYRKLLQKRTDLRNSLNQLDAGSSPTSAQLWLHVNLANRCSGKQISYSRYMFSLLLSPSQLERGSSSGLLLNQPVYTPRTN